MVRVKWKLEDHGKKIRDQSEKMSKCKSNEST